MSLLRFQTVLSYLYLDERLRNAVRLRGREALAGFNITEEEQCLIVSFVAQYSTELDLFAGTLRRKLKDKLSGLFPLLKGYLGDSRWESICAQYFDRRPCRIDRTGLEECEEFSDYVRGAMAVPDFDKIIFLDLISLECAKAAVLCASAEHNPLHGGPRPSFVILKPGVRMQALHHCPEAIAVWAQSHGESRPDKAKGRLWYVFFHPQNEFGRVKMFQIGRGLAAVLANALANAPTNEHEHKMRVTGPASLDAVHRSLRQLEAAGILTLESQKEISPKGRL
jgi:hypothetical protein